MQLLVCLLQRTKTSEIVIEFPLAKMAFNSLGRECMMVQQAFKHVVYCKLQYPLQQIPYASSSMKAVSLSDVSRRGHAKVSCTFKKSAAFGGEKP